MHKQQLRTVGIALLMVLFAGCTAEQPQKKVLREDVISKDLIEAVDTQDTNTLRARAERIASTGTKYMFLSSVSTSDRKAGETFPYMQGREALVKFEWTKNSLRVLNVERDPRFADNNVNFKPVLEIPVEHVDYKCSEDAYGDCTSREEENREIDSLKRAFFKPRISDTAVQMLTGVPLLGPSGGDSSCAQETSSRLVGYEFTKEAINVEIERTFVTKLRWNCISSIIQTWEGLSDLSFTARHYFSIVKLDNLRTKDYRPVIYSEAEENLFGFFKSQEITLSIDNNDVVDSKKMYLNRWAPNKVVNFYLNARFNRPEYKKIKQATIEGFKTINNSLEKAGAKLRVKLNEPVEDMAPGDLRYNMVVMVDDPINFGILGYGPAVKDPLTGEILKANTNMYLGVMKKGLRREYDQIIREKKAEASLLQARPSISLDPALESVILRPRVDQANLRSAATRVSTGRIPASAAPVANLAQNQKAQSRPQSSLIQNTRDFLKSFKISEFSGKDVNELIGLAVNPTNYSDATTDFNADQERYSRHNIYHSDMFNFHAAISQGVDDLIGRLGVREWSELNEGERAEVIDHLLPYVWVPTLVHEVGHNLGLRHNFGGSEDEENFYTAEELAAMGVKAKWEYSSIMDYAYRTTNELQVMGKYDIAALKYAYSEKLDTADGKVIPLAEYQRAIRENKHKDIKLKPYQYCSDEHVGANPNCKRHDEGINLTAIAQNRADAYNDNYGRINTRWDRRSYSLMGDLGYAKYVSSFFWNLRQMYERYETFKNRFNLADDNALWETNEFLKDTKAATILGAKHLIKVIKTPDTTCAIAKATDPSVVTNLIPLVNLSDTAISCFEDGILNAAYVVVGQTGKSFRSVKHPSNPNTYADQIDVRGIWIDKLIATKYLFARDFNSILFDKYTQNYLSVSEVKPLILETIDQVLNDEFVDDLEFVTKDGVKFSFGGDIVYSTHNEFTITRPYSESTRLMLNLPKESTKFRREFIQSIMRDLPSIKHSIEVQPLIDMLTAYSKISDMGRPVTDYRVLTFGTKKFYALPENTYANHFFDKYEMATRLIEAAKVVTRQRMIDIYVALANGTALGPLTPEEQTVADVGQDELYKFLVGTAKPPEFYIEVLQDLTEATESGVEYKYDASDLADAEEREVSIGEIQNMLMK